MPFKLIFSLLSLIVVAAFLGFNLDNRCDVSVIVYVFKNIPVCISMLFAFIAGAFATIPYYLSLKKRDDLENDKAVSQKKNKKKAPAPDNREYED